jgi:hypothetical protein
VGRQKLEQLTRAERVIAFIEKYCVIPEGIFVGQPARLRSWQRQIITGIYDDDPEPARRVIVSMARKKFENLALRCVVAGAFDRS